MWQLYIALQIFGLAATGYSIENAVRRPVVQFKIAKDNSHPFCCFWWYTDECSKNPNYMLKYCKSACAEGCMVKDKGKSHWGYTGDSGSKHWPVEYPDCGGKSQSPIDIQSPKTIQRRLFPFSLEGYYQQALRCSPKITNNGHTVKVDVPADECGEVTLNGGGLLDNYRLLQFHFHWGTNDFTGSEHLINGESYPLELHLVHLKEGLTLEEGLSSPDGLVVLGVLYTVSDSAGDELTAITEQLKEVTYGEAVTTMRARLILRRLLPSNLSEFYTYDGSLTTPPCAESVLWHVFKETMPVSPQQLAQFRLLTGLAPNYRPVQPLNGRSVISAV